MKTISLLLFLCAAAVGQSPEDLQKRYGPPIAESFTVRPGIVLNVTYGTGGKVAEMVFKPQSVSSESTAKPVMKSPIIYELIDELVPPSARGKFVMGTFLNITCLPDDNCHGAMDEYENVVVYRMGNDNAFDYIRIVWTEKRKKTSHPSDPGSVSPQPRPR